jgi:putative RNA 2'-phosphotransferase
MNEQQKKHISKFLSLILRHQPETIGLQLDEGGWASVSELFSKAPKAGVHLNQLILDEVVSTNDKQRFAFNEDRTKIRASQGHSVEVSLGLEPQKPPAELYHGTVAEFLGDISDKGIQRMSRQQVHLSVDKETAVKVGSRRGKPVILVIDSARMHEDGLLFYVSANGVWLTDEVPAKYIKY